MFQKFTQKAINIIENAQELSGDMGHNMVYSEHILLAAVAQAKGVDARIFESSGLEIDELQEIISKKLKDKVKYHRKGEIPFSDSAKRILEKAVDTADNFKSPFIMPQHIYLALAGMRDSGAYKILKQSGMDEDIIIGNFEKLITKKKVKIKHPETSETVDNDISGLFGEDKIKSVFDNAVSKLSTRGYEILGTEQIFQSIIESANDDLTEVFDKYGINRESYSQKLEGFSNRDDEYGGKKVIFTPNAFKAMLLAADAARESGSVEVGPEHLILGILKAKTGIAYKIIKDFIPATNDFEEVITRHLSTQVPETLSIMRLAKNEAQNMGKSTIGTEFILLGILEHKSGIAAATLAKLGITLSDVRNEIKKRTGVEAPMWDENPIIKSFTYTNRAKKLLDIAYRHAKKYHKNMIMSEDLLYAIVKQPDCLAMEILCSLGTDAVEISQGIVYQQYESGNTGSFAAEI